VDQPDPGLGTVGVGPVVQPGSGGRHRGEDAGTDEQVRGRCGARPADGVEQRGHAPRADRQVGEHRVQRVAQVGAAEQVTDSPRPHDSTGGGPQRRGDPVQGGDAFQADDEIVG